MDDYANQVNGYGTCSHLSQTLEKKKELPGSYSLLNQNVPENGVKIKYTSSNLCGKNDFYSLQIELICDYSLTEKPEYQINGVSVLSDPCAPIVAMKSASGCPIKSTGPLYRFNKSYNTVVATSMLVIGLGLLIFGWKFPQLTIVIITTLAFGTVMIVMVYTKVLPDYTPKWSVWIAVYFAYGLGLGLGIAGSYWSRFGVGMLSTLVGLFFGLTTEILILDKVI